MAKISNIYKIKCKKIKGGENILQLLAAGNARAEIITSFSASSPQDFWYDQNENELVSVLKGRAVLNIEGEIVKMKKGDYITIPSNAKHRVESTSSKCVWLCIYYQ